MLHHLQTAGRERGSEEYAVKQAIIVERAIRQQRSARMLCERVRDRQVRHHASRHLLFEDQSQSFLLLGKRKSRLVISSLVISSLKSNRNLFYSWANYILPNLFYSWANVNPLPISVLLARRSNLEHCTSCPPRRFGSHHITGRNHRMSCRGQHVTRSSAV